MSLFSAQNAPFRRVSHLPTLLESVRKREQNRLQYPLLFGTKNAAEAAAFGMVKGLPLAYGMTGISTSPGSSVSLGLGVVTGAEVVTALPTFCCSCIILYSVYSV